LDSIGPGRKLGRPRAGGRKEIGGEEAEEEEGISDIRAVPAGGQEWGFSSKNDRGFTRAVRDSKAG